jgi:hypothetical protein
MAQVVYTYMYRPMTWRGHLERRIRLLIVLPRICLLVVGGLPATALSIGSYLIHEVEGKWFAEASPARCEGQR